MCGSSFCDQNTRGTRQLIIDGKVNRSVNGYALWAAQAAQAEGAPFIDLNQLICDHNDSVGRERVTTLYFDEGETTH